METIPGLTSFDPGDEAPAEGSDRRPSRAADADADPAADGDADRASGGGSILVADDNDDCRMALRALLESMGHEVHEAADGEEAVQVALRVQPDLVLMDIMMPGVDGLEATRRLRSDSDLDDTLIVAVSAMEGACRASRAAGCDHCILKPIDLGGLDELVAGWLSDG